MAAVALRADYEASGLRALAKASKSGGLARRLLALAAIYEGGSRTDGARVGDVGLQTIRLSGKLVHWRRSGPSTSR